MTIRLRCSLFILLAMLLVPTGCLASENLSWLPVSYGGGGRFTAVAVDPSDPRIVYVGSDVAGIFRSRDGGNHFELAGKGLLGFAVADIAVNPAPPHQVVAITDDGLYYSVNQGESWIRISADIRYASRFFGSRLLLFTRQSLWIGTDQKGVFRLPLPDLTAAPQAVPGLEPRKVNALGVHDGYLMAGTAQGIYRWEGKKWVPKNSGLPAGFTEIMDLALSGQDGYALERRRGLFRWQEASQGWVQRPLPGKPSPAGYKSLFLHPRNPETVFVGSHPENWPHLLYRTQDGGSTWTSILSFEVDPDAPANWTNTFSGAEKIAHVPGTDGTFFLTDWWNLWQTSDGGKNWLQRHRGLQNTVINDLKIDPRNPRRLYLCAADNGLMVSEDEGRRWKRLMKGVVDGHAQELEISPHDPSRLILLMDPWERKGKVHLYESRDSGQTWRDIGFPLPKDPLPRRGYVDGTATNVEIDPAAADTIYVGTNGYGVYKTVDGGRNWLPMNRGLSTPYLKGPGALKVHPRVKGLLFASTQQGGVYRSTDGAVSWERTTGERFAFGMAIDSATPSQIVVGCAGNGLLLSDDEGKSWQEIRLPVPTSPQMAVYTVAFHPQRPGMLLAGTLRYDVRATEGLLVSLDGAKTFRRLPMDLPRLNIRAIAWLPGQSDAAYVGFNGSGVFKVQWGGTR